MNEFVNFRKRSVELPTGCKDLIDVLDQAKRHPESTLIVSSGERLTDVARHVRRLLEPETKSRYLVITWDQMNYLQLMNQEGALTAQAVVHENTHRAQAIRAVFGAVNLVPISDEAAAGGCVRVLRYALPDGASSI